MMKAIGWYVLLTSDFMVPYSDPYLPFLIKPCAYGNAFCGKACCTKEIIADGDGSVNDFTWEKENFT